LSLRISYWVLILPALILGLFWTYEQAYAQQTPLKNPPVKQPLNWTAPPDAHVTLEAGATITDDIVTYTIYPVNTSNHAVWDLHIRVPVPAGASFLVAGAPASFISGFDGRAVSFSTSELSDQGAAPLLSFQISVKHVTTPSVTTQASATWRYVQTNLGQSIFAEGKTTGADIVIQPHVAQQVVTDMKGDVPFTNYDLTGVVLQQDQGNLKITLDTAGPVGAVGSGHNEYNVYIDSDCDASTGRQRSTLGFDYRVRYQHDKGLASLNIWGKTTVVTDTTTITDTNAITASDTSTDSGKTGSWHITGSLSAISPPTGRNVTIWVPGALLPDNTQFCWAADAQDRSNDFEPRPPTDDIPGMSGKLLMTQYNAEKTIGRIVISDPITETIGYTNNGSIRLVHTITPTLALVRPDFATVKGKLALSLANEQGDYDVHIFGLPDGQEVAKIANATRPIFKFEGKSLLINRKDGAYEHELLAGAEVRVGNALSTTHPFYDSRGMAVVYENADLTNTNAQSFAPLFQLCDWAPSQQGTKSQCRPLPVGSAAALTGLPSELRGAYPVWAANDTIVYQGCAAWIQPDACGIYALRTTRQSGNDEVFLRQLTHVANDLPADAKGNVIAFASHGAGDWEVYVMRLDGVWVKNLSQSQNSQDILPAISPNGNWVAFVSNRSGKWAVWVTPVLDGEPHKLFDLPGSKPWGDNDQGWQEQHLTWGP
jgi:hypothetical protein